MKEWLAFLREKDATFYVLLVSGIPQARRTEGSKSHSY